MKKLLTARTAFIVLAIFFLLVIVLGSTKVDKHPIEITQQEVQEKFDEKIKEGLEKKVKLVNLRLTDADVKLTEGLVKVTYTIQLSSKGLKLSTLQADASGDLKCRGGGLYLHQADFHLLDLKADSLTGEIAGKATHKVLKWAKNRVGEKIGMDLSEDTDALKADATTWLRSLVAEQLENRPIYRFKGFTGVVISSALHEDGLEIHDGKILAYISYWGVAYGFMVAGLLTLIGLILAGIFAVWPHRVLRI